MRSAQRERLRLLFEDAWLRRFSARAGRSSDMDYDPLRDFTPITRIAAVHNVLVVHPSLPVKTVKAFVTHILEVISKRRLRSGRKW